ncbi:DUF3560 domain-containing protein [Fundidesulfovibrio putealis]|uniref:DUF3560 domain-containing protein n=1 Tax=Fundidesulfovibrio putealis TaxID=270496 RepID=UPI00041754A0|nr:DUF3560 domain-containing protein [Fundidesulfovibrio putealis]KAF0234886.1 MAG: hypothetical protein FD177_449 [Desulfovibrionaceae bacterium]
MQTMTATYSPEDNKLRLYASSRLDAGTYARVKAAGYKWAPQQELFVAPMWTPEREDLALELCGEIGDEDTSLVDRAEDRAERFEGYSEKRAADAHSARKAVDTLADGIPLGQPILVGHHSEKRARKDAERIENGMRKAVNLWETSKYWTTRAAGALAHAKYKELPGVRARRIKTLEADKRKQERSKAQAEMFLKLWANDAAAIKRKDGEPLTFRERALYITDRDHISRCFPLSEYPRTENTYEGSRSLWSALEDNIITPEQARDIAVEAHSRMIPWHDRWIAHYDNRLAYEKAMLEEQGASALLEKKPRPKQLPICNYRAPEGIAITRFDGRGQSEPFAQVEMTQAEYAAIWRDYKGTRMVDNSHRVRIAIVKSALVCVYLTDAKVHERPATIEVEAPKPQPRPIVPAPSKEENEDDKAFQALKEAAKKPVEVKAVPQLFPTPNAIAEQMVDLADIHPDHRVLEPSAGTGNLLRAIGDQPDKVAVEINLDLAEGLTRLGLSGLHIHRADFLACNGDLGTFDRIVMNPPFENGVDIKHIKHALHMLRPGGVLVALCANGPRQNDELKPLATTWENLPEGSFKEAGTGVRVALLTISKPHVRERAEMQSLI